MNAGDNDYVLATGEEGARRLRVVNAVHGPDSERLLRRAGLGGGMRVADIGCGTGMVSAWIAKEVGPDGELAGVDVSPGQVALARAETERCGLKNARFSVAAAAETGLPRAAFDLVYCRFVLMHVPDPAAALREMRALLKPGGTLVCEDGDFTTPFCEPDSPAYQRCFELYRAAGDRRGLDFRIGPKLYRLFLDAGMPVPEVALAQPVFVRGEEKRLPEWTLLECAPALLDADLATRKELDALAAELASLARDETALFGMVRMTQVWAQKT
jgi:SAM-dependent methyltransferase